MVSPQILEYQVVFLGCERLEHHDYDIEKAFEVVEVYPSADAQLGVSKIDPQDPKSANLGLLIGEVDITMVGGEDPLDRKKFSHRGTLMPIFQALCKIQPRHVPWGGIFS